MRLSQRGLVEVRGGAVVITGGGAGEDGDDDDEETCDEQKQESVLRDSRVGLATDEVLPKLASRRWVSQHV